MKRQSAIWSIALGLAVFAPCAAEAVPRRGPAPLPAGPSPLAFAVEPVANTWRWRWSLRNTGSQPLEVVTDRRLVWLEVPPPAEAPMPGGRGARRGRRATRPVRCVHEARPTSPEVAVRTTLAPGERYSELVDVRDVCRLRVPAGVAPGGSVVAHYGFEPVVATRGRRPPLARWMARTVTPDLDAYPVNDLVAPVTVQAFDVPAAPAVVVGRAPAVPPPVVSMRDASAARGEGLRVSVRLRNEGARPVWALWRTTLAAFTLETPSGRAVSCDVLLRQPNPFREFFVRLGRGQSRAMTVVPYEYCPLGTFDEPGLYRTVAVYDTRAEATSWNPGRIFSGRVTSTPAMLRIARGAVPYRPFGLEITR